MIAEVPETSAHLPDAVATILARTLSSLGDLPVTREQVNRLSVCDLQFLLRVLEVSFQPGSKWYTARCSSCEKRFDYEIDLGVLPVKNRGEGYPFAMVDVRTDKFCFRAITGEDQIALTQVKDETRARELLIKRCLVNPSLQTLEDDFIQTVLLSNAVINRVEATIDKVSPAITTTIETPCPHCHASMETHLDPYGIFDRNKDSLLAEVHKIAWHYHWSEHEILTMGQSRRHHYIDLIDRERLR